MKIFLQTFEAREKEYSGDKYFLPDLAGEPVQAGFSLPQFLVFGLRMSDTEVECEPNIVDGANCHQSI